MNLELLLRSRSKDPYRRRKGRVLEIILVGMVAGLLIVAVYNAVEGEPKYYAMNAAFASLLLGLLLLNRLGFVRLAGLSTVVLTGIGSFLLSGDDLTATFVTMPLPSPARSLDRPTESHPVPRSFGAGAERR